jgi:hypothetical protein
MIAAYLNKTPEEVALATTFNALKVRNNQWFRLDPYSLNPNPVPGFFCDPDPGVDDQKKKL